VRQVSGADTADTAIRLRDVREVNGADTADTAIRLRHVREVSGMGGMIVAVTVTTMTVAARLHSGNAQTQRTQPYDCVMCVK
jgi:hypothetical protein